MISVDFFSNITLPKTPQSLANLFPFQVSKPKKIPQQRRPKKTSRPKRSPSKMYSLLHKNPLQSKNASFNRPTCSWPLLTMLQKRLHRLKSWKSIKWWRWFNRMFPTEMPHRRRSSPSLMWVFLESFGNNNSSMKYFVEKNFKRFFFSPGHCLQSFFNSIILNLLYFQIKPESSTAKSKETLAQIPIIPRNLGSGILRRQALTADEKSIRKIRFNDQFGKDLVQVRHFDVEEGERSKLCCVFKR